MQASEKQGSFRGKLDRFWSALFLTPEGKPKSAVLLYSFCLSLLYLAVYGVAYFFLIDLIETACAGCSVGLRNLLQSILPGIAGSLVCCSLTFIIRDRRIVPAAYVWLFAFAIAALIAMAILSDGEGFRIFLYFFFMLVPAGLLSGAAFSFLMFRAHLEAAAAP